MPAKPTSFTIRAYDVGFGDCFLMSIQYPNDARHVLIDFGSTALPTGKKNPGRYLQRIANQIAHDCAGKLTAVVATHRHRDHMSGFGGSGANAPGTIIRNLKPDIVIQPWTEDPDIARDATKPTARLRGARLRRSLMVRNLADMNRFAAFAEQAATHLRGSHLKSVRDQLGFLGDDNSLKNRDAVVNLMTMGKRKPRYLFSGAPSGLGGLLPGVKVHVLGPPTVEQAPDVKTQTDTQKDEFWHLRASFWARRGVAAAHADTLTKPLFLSAVTRVPWDARWYRYHAQREQAESLLSIVRTLDKAMNNTSLVLLFEIGDTCLLFPGDAQWENWSYALGQEKYRKLLARVTVYKVGHHGSLNATPKTLWKGFANKGGASKPHRLVSLLSTKDGVHGHSAATAVPRSTLVTALKDHSTLIDTRDATPEELSRVQTIEL